MPDIKQIEIYQSEDELVQLGDALTKRELVGIATCKDVLHVQKKMEATSC